MKRIISVVAAAASLAACETAPLGPPVPAYPPPPSASIFRDQDFAWSTQSGTGRIDGVLAYRGGGGRYTCRYVILAPETPWSRQRMRTLYLSTTAAADPVDAVRARTPPEHEADYAHYARETNCDASGRFSFSGLPDGGWYVITVANPVAGGVKMAVMRYVETSGGAERVVLR